MSTSEVQKSLSERFDEHRRMMKSIVSELEGLLLELSSLLKLQSKVFTYRQEAVEYQHDLMNILEGITKTYNEKYSARFKIYKENTQVMYRSEGQIQTLIEGELSTEKYQMGLFDIQISFMTETIKTIDKIIANINNRLTLAKDFSIV